jgi:hypothetical protein
MTTVLMEVVFPDAIFFGSDAPDFGSLLGANLQVLYFCFN